MLFNGSKTKLLVYNKKDAYPHFEINGTDVSTSKYEMVFDGIKKLNCSVNKFMSEVGSLQTVVKNKLFHQYCCALYGS